MPKTVKDIRNKFNSFFRNENFFKRFLRGRERDEDGKERKIELSEFISLAPFSKKELKKKKKRKSGRKMTIPSVSISLKNKQIKFVYF